MPIARVSADVVEALHQAASDARVSQHVIELLRPFTAPTAYAPVTPALNAGTYGDACNTVTLDAGWTLRNIASVGGNGSEYSVLLDAQGDTMTRPFTDSGQDFCLTAHLRGITAHGGMIGIVALDASNNGRGFAPYNDNATYQWGVTAYNYSATVNGIAGVPTVGDHVLQLRRVGTNWSGRYSSQWTVGGTWSPWTTVTSDGRTITKIGLGRLYTAGGSQTVGLEAFVYSTDTSGALAFTNTDDPAIVSQHVIELLRALTPQAIVSQHVIEALYSAAGSHEGGAVSGGSETRSYGIVV